MTKKEKVDELIIANKELAYQNEEKEKRPTELILANEAILQSEGNIEIINAGSAEHKEVQVKNLKILIVEDDKVSASLLARMLQNISKEVLHEITGIKAVEACRNNPDLDLILMDIRMPQMDGNEAARQVRQFNRDIIIIAQSANAFSGDFEKAIEAGCNDYISKPIDKTLLYELIKKHVINREEILTR
jgi:CheY-like chemotaxis protein